MYAWSCVPGCVFGYLLCPWMCGHVYVFNSAFGCVSLNMCFTISMMVSLDVCLTACLAPSLNAMECVLGYIPDNIFHCMHDWIPHYHDYDYVLNWILFLDCLPWPVSLIFSPQFEFDGNFALLLFRCWPSNRNIFLNMVRQHSCRAMHKIL